MIYKNIAQKVFLVALLVSSAMSECNRLETDEAEKSFKNCVESAQAGIIRRAAQADSEQEVCDDLDNMLDVCSKQTRALARCKGQHHADKVEKLHLSATADIVKSFNQKVDVEKCAVFSRKTRIPMRPKGGESKPNTSPVTSAEPEGNKAGVSPMVDFLLLVTTLISTFIMAKIY